MPKFHFEIVNGHKIEDPQGMELPTEYQAQKMAEELAKQIAVDLDDDSLKEVVVKTDAGMVIHKASIKTGSKT